MLIIARDRIVAGRTSRLRPRVRLVRMHLSMRETLPGSLSMTVEYAKAIATIEVSALNEVHLGSREGETLFKRLMLDAVTQIVEEHLQGGARLGGRHVDGEEDGDGDGPRLHGWLDRSGAIYRLVILRFDRETRSPPIVTDTMAVVYGERVLIGRFVVYPEPGGSIAIEHIPDGRLSDDRPARGDPRRPSLATKPVVHRVGAAVRTVLTWLAGAAFAIRAAVHAFRQRAKELSSLAASLNQMLAMIASLKRRRNWQFGRSWTCLFIESALTTFFDCFKRVRVDWWRGLLRPSAHGHDQAFSNFSLRPTTIRIYPLLDFSGAHLARVHGVAPKHDPDLSAASPRARREPPCGRFAAEPEARRDGEGHDRQALNPAEAERNTTALQ
jgi:hypothetical protein